MMFKTILFLSLPAVLPLTAAVQDESHHTTFITESTNGDALKIKVLKQGDNQDWKIEVDGEEISANPESIPVGESKTFTLADERELTLRRGEDGALFIRMGDEPEIALLDTGRHQANAYFFRKGNNAKLKWHSSNQVTLSGLSDVDQAIQDSIRQAVADILDSHGLDKEVKLADNVFFTAHDSLQGDDMIIEHTGHDAVIDFKTDDIHVEGDTSVEVINKGDKRIVIRKKIIKKHAAESEENDRL